MIDYRSCFYLDIKVEVDHDHVIKKHAADVWFYCSRYSNSNIMAQSRDCFVNSSNQQTHVDSSGVDLIHNTVLPSDDQLYNRIQCHCCHVRSSRPCILVQTTDGAGLKQYDADDTWRFTSELTQNDVSGRSATLPYVTSIVLQ